MEPALLLVEPMQTGCFWISVSSWLSSCSCGLAAPGSAAPTLQLAPMITLPRRDRASARRRRGGAYIDTQGSVPVEGLARSFAWQRCASLPGASLFLPLRDGTRGPDERSLRTTTGPAF